MIKYSVLSAIRILSFLKTGSSRPVVIETGGGERYMVKLKGGLSGRWSVVCEWVAAQIGKELGLPVSVPSVAVLDSQTTVIPGNDELQTLVKKSYGLNLAYTYYEDEKPWAPGVRHWGEVLTRLFVLDLFLLNADRTSNNLNLMETDGRLLSFDYESSLLIIGILDGNDYRNAESVIRALRQNPLFTPEIQASDIESEFSTLGSINPEAVVDSIPDEWLGKKLRAQLAVGLREATRDMTPYIQLLEAVKSRPYQTEEERRQLARKNRMEFERKLER